MRRPITASPVARFPANWLQAACYERDRRANSYPRLVAAGELDEEKATIDYQAWVAIADWMAEGRCWLIGGWGGVADPPVTVLTWALLEQSAEDQLASIEARIEALAGEEGADQAKLARLRERRDAIWCIHNLMVKQREAVEPTARAETAWARPPADAGKAVAA